MMGKRFITFTMVLAFLGTAVTAFAQEDSSTKAFQAYNDGKAKADAKEYAAALELFTEAIEVGDPEKEYDAQIIDASKKNGAIAAYYVGNDLRKAEKFDEALATYEKGIEYSPDLYYNYVGRAQAFSSKGDYAGSVTAYFKAAEVAEAAGSGDKAGGMLEQAAKLPGIAWSKKDWDVAVATAEAYLEQEETGDAHYYLGQSLKEKGEMEKAAEHTMKAAEMYEGEDQDKAYYRLGEIYEAMGKKQEAIEAYGKAGGKYSERAKYKADQLGG